MIRAGLFLQVSSVIDRIGGTETAVDAVFPFTKRGPVSDGK